MEPIKWVIFMPLKLSGKMSENRSNIQDFFALGVQIFKKIDQCEKKSENSVDLSKSK